MCASGFSVLEIVCVVGKGSLTFLVQADRTLGVFKKNHSPSATANIVHNVEFADLLNINRRALFQFMCDCKACYCF